MDLGFYYIQTIIVYKPYVICNISCVFAKFQENLPLGSFWGPSQSSSTFIIGIY